MLSIEDDSMRTSGRLSKTSMEEDYHLVFAKSVLEKMKQIHNFPDANDLDSMQMSTERIRNKLQQDSDDELSVEGEYEHYEDYSCSSEVPHMQIDPLTGEKIPEKAKVPTVWKGYFRGYESLTPESECAISDNKKCVELTLKDCTYLLDTYLRNGVRCFIIDLFAGTEEEKESLIVRLRESENKVKNEYGYPITTTLIARLSPRLQYTGLMQPVNAVHELKEGDQITLTADRFFSSRSTKKHVYVNANFLMIDVKLCDHMLIGDDIQVRVDKNQFGHMRCTVIKGGKLKSRQPVLFPSKCQKYHISGEEIEDITFAKAIGINIVVSYIFGTNTYLTNLKYCMQVMNCEKLRLFTRLILNELAACETDMKWALECYDGFLIEFTPLDDEHDEELLKLCPAAADFLEQIYKLRKPIILDPKYIAERRFVVDPDYKLHVYYYPDKYLYKCTEPNNAFYFYSLQKAIFDQLPMEQLSLQPYCDESHTGSDTMARAIVSTSLEIECKIILVCSLTGRMAIKISHFRPKAPIILVTSLKSTSNYICLYHNILVLMYCVQQRKLNKANEKKSENELENCDGRNYKNAAIKQILYGINYALARRMIKHDNQLLIVYSSETGTKLQDKHITFRFDEKHYAEHIKKLFKKMH